MPIDSNSGICCLVTAPCAASDPMSGLGASHDLGYSSKTQSGLLEHKVTTVLRADGSEKVTEQVRVTAKGLTKLAQLIKPALSEA